MSEERLLAGQVSGDEATLERHIRPQRLDEFVGQPELCEQLKIFIQAAQKRGDVLDHVLVFGPPGLGKTTLSHIIAHEMGSQLRQTSGPTLEKGGDLVAMLSNLEEGDVLFIDEIHRLAPAIEELLYPALEDGYVEIVIGEGPSARTIQLTLPDFTLVGATTRAGLLTSPLRDRFGIVERLNFYTANELMQIVQRSAEILKLEMESEGMTEIAARARGTPRIANRLLRRVRDYAEVRADGRITGKVAREALEFLHVDRLGIDQVDREFLRVLLKKFGGGPVGIDSISVAINEDRGTLEDLIEPYLIQQGLLMRTPRGRVATLAAWKHLELDPPPGAAELPLGQWHP